jgi:hypothetical protein
VQSSWCRPAGADHALKPPVPSFTALQTLNLSCQYQQQGASSKCKLVVYYNSTVPSLRSLKPFGIPTYALPKLPSAPLRSAEMNATEMKLNRTEPIYNSIMWPLLYFHGGPSCHVRFESPVIREVELPKQSGEGSQVLPGLQLYEQQCSMMQHHLGILL